MPPKIALTNKYWQRHLVASELEPTLIQLGQKFQRSHGNLCEFARMATGSDLVQIWQWNKVVPISVDKCAHTIIQERIDAQPARPAVCAWDGTLRYAELGRLAAILASRLIYIGVGPGTASIIPLCFEKSVWTTVAMLGVLKAGAGFALLDPQQPEHRLRSIVNQVGANIIISSRESSELSSRLAPESVVLSSGFFESRCDLSSAPLRIPGPSSVAYVAFTSGSTGQPKGALISHGNVASALHHQRERMGFSTTTRFYDFSSYSFDASIGIFFTTLEAGGCICVPSEEDRRDNLIQSILSLNANTVDLTPSVAALLSPEVVPSLETLILGGETLQVRDVNTWWNSVKVMSFYGPCECTPTSTINYDATRPEEAIHLGKGAGLVTWLVDPENHHSLVELGAVGELVLEGPLVGLGYLHDPERTASSFIEDPAWLLAGVDDQQGRHGRVYKTGDLVRYRDDGALVFAGRKDTQVKVRGQRVELQEIENALRAVTGVDDAVAVLQKSHENDSEWIAAFVTFQAHKSAFHHLSPLEQWESRLAGLTAHVDGGDPYGIPTRLLAKRGLMQDTSESNMKQIGRWLARMLDPMANNGEFHHLPEGCSSHFILYSLPEATLTSHASVTRFIDKTIDSTPALEGKVTVYKAASEDLGPQCFPMTSGIVVLNSIIQFFPSQAYLLNVVREALSLGNIKAIVFGDVHSNVLYQESLAEGAWRLFGESISSDDLRNIAEFHLDESELLVSPTFFTTLFSRFPDEIVNVEILPECDAGDRLGSFRYTAIIHVGPQDTQLHIRSVSGAEWINFGQQGLDDQALLCLLQKDLRTLPVTNIPYARCEQGRRLRQLLHEGKKELASHIRVEEYKRSLSVHDLVSLARQTERRLDISWGLQPSQDGALTAVFFYHDSPTNGDKTRVMFDFSIANGPNAHVATLCSQPVQQDTNEKIRNHLLEKVRLRLPLYMVPRTIKILDKMPLNKNCKIDRRALAESTQFRVQQRARMRGDKILSQPEIQVRQIWGESLGIEPTTIGRNDRFFDIGGDSITAMKVVLEAQHYGLTMTVRDVFLLEVHEMAGRISSLQFP